MRGPRRAGAVGQLTSESRPRLASERLHREIEHHRAVADQDVERIWGWASPAGRRRADRRAALFAAYGAISPGTRVLEVGCGTGEFTSRIAPCGADLVALDLSAELLTRARAKVSTGARFVRGDAQRLPFSDASFDVVYGCSILHHLDPESALREVRRVLRFGGRLAFSEPNLLNPQVWIMFKCNAIRPYFGNSPDEMAFTRPAISRILDRVGFSRFSVRYFDFLHPLVPAGLVPATERLSILLEQIPFLRAVSGSMFIQAQR